MGILFVEIDRSSLQHKNILFGDSKTALQEWILFVWFHLESSSSSLWPRFKLDCAVPWHVRLLELLEEAAVVILIHVMQIVNYKEKNLIKDVLKSVTIYLGMEVPWAQNAYSEFAKNCASPVVERWKSSCH